MGGKFSWNEMDQLTRIANGEDVKSSDRASDQARTRLKRLGLIEFKREWWRWFITDAGRQALAHPLQQAPMKEDR